MKYSSTTSLGVSGDLLSMEDLGMTLLLDGAQHLDAAQHNAFVDLVGVERNADRPEQHDRQAAAEMLAEFVEPAQDGRLIAMARGELRRVDREAQRSEEANHAAPVTLGEKPREM